MVLYLQIICWKLWCWTRDFLQILPKVIVNMLQYNSQKQPSIGVLMKRCSENMQHIYRRTLMPKRDFDKVAKQLLRICLILLEHLYLGTNMESCFSTQCLKFYDLHLWQVLRNNGNLSISCFIRWLILRNVYFLLEYVIFLEFYKFIFHISRNLSYTALAKGGCSWKFENWWSLFLLNPSSKSSNLLFFKNFF